MQKTKHWLMTIAALLCSVAVNAYDFYANGIYYNVTSDADLTVEVTFVNTYSADYSGAIYIPSLVTYNRKMYSVTRIGNYAFNNCRDLTSVTIPESVRSIGYAAFDGCNNFREIRISNIEIWCNTTKSSVPMHDLYLNGELVTELVVPDMVTVIKRGAFYYCRSLTSIIIPNSVTSIEENAFYGCYNLASIHIPESVMSIGANAFSYCTGELFINCNIPSTSSNTEGVCFNSCFSKVTIGENVTFIGDYAFENSGNLTSVIIPEDSKLTSIGRCAFRGCSSLTSITIPEGVTEIRDRAFSGCSSLTNITIPEGVTEIEYNVFDDTAWYNNQSDGIVYINKILYRYKGAMPEDTKIKVKKGIVSINSQAFSNCDNLISITIPESVTSIKKSAFQSCTSLSEIYFEDGESVLSLGAQSIGSYYSSGKGLFYDCKQLRKAYIGRELDFETDKQYGYSPFYGMNIDTLIISKKQSRNLRLGSINKQATLLYMDNDYSKVLPAGLQENCTLHYFNAPHNSPYYKDVAGYLKNELSCNAQMVPLGNISAGFYSLEVTLNDTLLKHEVRNRVPVTTGPNKKPILRRYVKINGDTIKTNAAGVYKCENLEMNTSYNVEFIYNGYRDNLYKQYTTSTTVSTQKVESTCNVSPTLSTATIRYNMGDTIGLGKPISEIGVYFYSNGTHYPADGKDEWHNLPYHTTIKDLHPGNSYSYQIYWKIDTTYNYSESQHFNTKSPTITLVENEISTQTTATLKVIGEYKDNNISPVEVGVMLDYKSYWGGYQHKGQYIADSDGHVLITGLKPDTTYTMTPYIKYNEEDFYPITGTSLKITTDSISIACNCVATSATTLTIKGTHDAGDATVMEYGFCDHAANMDQTTLTGLDPNGTYTFTYYVTTAEGGTVYKSITAKTEELTFNTLKAKATSHTRAIICAKANIANEESGTGFEWRRIDAPDLVPSEFAGCAVHDSIMEGVLENLSANTYYKYRPFYTSASGQSYYGEWIGFGTADAYVYFAPTVHTYATSTGNTNIVCLTGYVLPGSDDIVEQGFEYWQEESATRSSNNITKVIANGQRMSVLVENLEYGTRYKYRAFATTAKETIYGETQMFETPTITEIEDITYHTSPVISSRQGIIYIDNVDEKCRVRVFTLSGMEIYEGYDREIRVESGIYIVCTSTITKKLQVK